MCDFQWVTKRGAKTMCSQYQLGYSAWYSIALYIVLLDKDSSLLACQYGNSYVINIYSMIQDDLGIAGGTADSPRQVFFFWVIALTLRDNTMCLEPAVIPASRRSSC